MTLTVVCSVPDRWHSVDGCWHLAAGRRQCPTPPGPGESAVVGQWPARRLHRHRRRRRRRRRHQLLRLLRRQQRERMSADYRE